MRSLSLPTFQPVCSVLFFGMRGHALSFTVPTFQSICSGTVLWNERPCALFHCSDFSVCMSRTVLWNERPCALFHYSDFSVCMFCTVLWNERPCALFPCSDFSVCVFPHGNDLPEWAAAQRLPAALNGPNGMFQNCQKLILKWPFCPVLFCWNERPRALFHRFVIFSDISASTAPNLPAQCLCLHYRISLFRISSN
jgi:hypothetical protein